MKRTVKGVHQRIRSDGRDRSRARRRHKRVPARVAARELLRQLVAPKVHGVRGAGAEDDGRHAAP